MLSPQNTDKKYMVSIHHKLKVSSKKLLHVFCLYQIIIVHHATKYLTETPARFAQLHTKHKTVFNSHKIAYPQTTTEEKIYNCIVKERQPLNNCLTNTIIWKAILTSNNQIDNEKFHFKTAHMLTCSNHKKINSS